MTANDLAAAVERLRQMLPLCDTRQWQEDVRLVLSAMEAAQAAMPPREPTRHPCGHLIVSDECVAYAQDQSAATPRRSPQPIADGAAQAVTDGPAADPIAGLCTQIRSFLADAPHGLPHEGFRYGELLSFAADALERLARERDDTRAMLRNTNHDAARLASLVDKYKWQVRDTCVRAERAEAERDALRARVRKLEQQIQEYAQACAAAIRALKG